MKIIIQRVKKAQVNIEGQVQGKSIKVSYCWSVLAQMTRREDLDYAVRKLVNMRIFQMQKAR